MRKTNKDADKLLEEARKEHDGEKRDALLREFTTEVAGDVPAVFIYSPDFLYAVSPLVRGMNTGLITTEPERFIEIQNWYINSERVWKWFKDRLTRTL